MLLEGRGVYQELLGRPLPREKLDREITLYVSQDMEAALDRLKEAFGKPRNKVIVRLLTFALKHVKP